MQYENARTAGVEKSIPSRALFEELKHIAQEPNPAEALRSLESEGLIGIFSPALAGPKLNLASLVRLERALRLLPEDNGTRAARLGPFLYALTEKLTPKEKGALIKSTDMRKAEVELWQKLEGRARKLEQALKSQRVRKPSQVYQILSKAADDEVVFVLYHSQNKPVLERIRNYYQKYVPMAQEIGETELQAIDAKPGTSRYEKAREALVLGLLDRRPRKPPPPPAEVIPVEIVARGRR